MGVCMFCGPTEAQITKEHVWPVWVSAALKDVMQGDTVYHRRYEGDVVAKEWQAGEINLQVKDLCTPCNRDWLGEFEGAVVKPLLAKAITTGSSLALSSIEQSTVAAWACKMAMVYEFANPGKPVFFTAADRLAFRDTTKALPEVEIRLAKYAFADKRFGHCHSACYDLTEAFGDRRALALFVTTMMAGHLAMQLIAVRDRASGALLPAATVDVEYNGPAMASLAQVWPTRRPRVTWPPANVLDEEQLLRLSEMWNLGATEDRRFRSNIPLGVRP